MNSLTIPSHASLQGFNVSNIIESVFAHELGHTVGLEDGFSGNPIGGGNNGSLMNHGRNRNIVRGPTAFDVESVNMIYHNGVNALSLGIDNFAEMQPGEETETMLVSGDYPHYNSITQLSSIATDVVRVEVLSERVERLNTWLETPPSGVNPYALYTVYQIKVLETFQGNATPGDILEVRQIGGQQGNEVIINTSKTPITVGDDLVLFLRASYIDNYPSVLLNPYQSAYHFAPTRARNAAFESVHYGNDLTLTLEDLEEIARR